MCFSIFFLCAIECVDDFRLTAGHHAAHNEHQRIRWHIKIVDIGHEGEIA